MNGELVDWDKAQVHVLTHTLHYGMGVFEGIRAYETADGPAVFRLTDHIVRLANSAKILGMELPYTVDVCTLMASNMRQPASRQCGSPVMRYMYHTDSMASGLVIVSEGSGEESVKERRCPHMIRT